jgi:single-strand DNA-binding protein
VSTGELPFPVWKEKLQWAPIFLSNSGIERFLERIRGNRAWPSRNGDGQQHQTQLTTSHITMNINRITITGNLVADPTLRNTDSGTPVASATIANNEFYNDGEGERQQVTTFVDVTVWGKPAENFSKLAKKGQEIVIEGRLRRNDWESEDGQKHSKHFVRAETWQFTQYKKD